MRIALIGGTGKLGRGLAVRLSTAHEPLIGSRDEAKARSSALELQSVTGRKIASGSNEQVAAEGDLAILAVPSASDASFLKELRSHLAGKLVISAMVPMVVEQGIARYQDRERSSAEEAASLLPESRIVAALHNVPARTLEQPGAKLDYDILTACDSLKDFEEAAQVIRSIEGLRPLYVGPLRMARFVEAITPVLLNAAKLNGLKRLSIKLVT